jgi:hypothetical protein
LRIADCGLRVHRGTPLTGFEGVPNISRPV